jgi:hypothetical protein
MKFLLSVAFLTAFALTSCEVDEPPVKTKHTASKYPAKPQSQYPTQPQPFPTPSPIPGDPIANVPQEPSAPAPAAPPTAKGDYPYGVPVPGKTVCVRSPYSPDKMTDVRGYAPGTEVKDPYTGKIFLVP